MWGRSIAMVLKPSALVGAVVGLAVAVGVGVGVGAIDQSHLGSHMF